MADINSNTEQSEPLRLYPADPKQFYMDQNKQWNNYDQRKFDETFKKVEKDGVTYYIAEGEEFKFLVHVIDTTLKNVKPNGSTLKVRERIKYLQEFLPTDPGLWLNSGLNNNTISCSTISDRYMETFCDALRGTGDVILGFNENNPEQVYGFWDSDAGIDRDDKPAIHDKTIYNLAREPGYRTGKEGSGYNEVLISRNNRRPDYIISPFPPGDKRNENNIKWANEYGIPIVYINTAVYIKKYEQELLELLAPLDQGIIPKASDYAKIRHLCKAINAIGYASDSKLHSKISNIDYLIYTTLVNNITKSNIDNYYEIYQENEIVGALGRASYDVNPSEKMFDVFIMRHNLKEKYPNLSRNDIVAIIMKSYIKNGGSKYDEHDKNFSTEFPREAEDILNDIENTNAAIEKNGDKILEYDGIPIIDDSYQNIYADRNKLFNYYNKAIGKYFDEINTGHIPAKESVSKILAMYKGISSIGKGYTCSYSREFLETLILRAVDMNPTIENADKALGILDMNGLNKDRIYGWLVGAASNMNPSNWIFDAVIRHYGLKENYPYLTRDEIVGVIMKAVLTPRDRPVTNDTVLKSEIEALNEYSRQKMMKGFVVQNQEIEKMEQTSGRAR